VTAGTRSAAQAADSKPVELLGRVGLAAYGLVHLLIAWLAAQVALGTGGEEGAGKDGALTQLAEKSWGSVLLWVIAVGMFALAIWQLGEAVWGRKSHGSPLKRVVHVIEALVFGFLGYSAAKIASGGKGQSNSEQAGLTADVLAKPAGQVLVAAVGIAVMGAAVYLIIKGAKKKFLKDLDFARASASTRRLTERLGQVGYIAQGVSYGIVGLLIVVAAVKHDPKQATGLDTALATLSEQTYGTALLLLVALGLACFGAYCFLDARFRKA
jgi:amino acid transporter